MLRDYFSRLRLLSRDARLFLVSSALLGFVFLGGKRQKTHAKRFKHIASLHVFSFQNTQFFYGLYTVISSSSPIRKDNFPVQRLLFGEATAPSRPT